MKAATQTRRAPLRGSPRRPSSRAWAVGRRDSIEILQAKLLAQLPRIVHGFSTRPGGASQLGGVGVLNLGFTEWDTRAAVESNRKRFVEALGAGGMQVVTLRQIHSDLVHQVTQAGGSALKGDAALTRTAGVLLAVQTADCVPILLADAKHGAVAAVHAGWRGTLKRIAAKALGRMRMEFGTRPGDVVAALGPGIGRCCYEVGPEVAQAFHTQFAKAEEWFEGPFAKLASGEDRPPLKWLWRTAPGHDPPPPCVHLDLAAANRWQLLEAGLKPANLVASDLCTACRTDLFFSHRREAGRTGRLLAVIGLRD